MKARSRAQEEQAGKASLLPCGSYRRPAPVRPHRLSFDQQARSSVLHAFSPSVLKSSTVREARDELGGAHGRHLEGQTEAQPSAAVMRWRSSLGARPRALLAHPARRLLVTRADLLSLERRRSECQQDTAPGSGPGAPGCGLPRNEDTLRRNSTHRSG